MTALPLMLFVAALLEIGGDAAIRQGLLRPSWAWLALGVATLAAYGFAVNANRTIDFGHLMGLYIAVFFVVSQVLNFLLFGVQPTPGVLLGGSLIVLGGLVILFGSAP